MDFEQKNLSVFCACAALAIGIFVLDLTLPLGVAGGVPYIAPVLLGLFASDRRFVLWVAVAGSVLTSLGYVYSPDGGIVWMVMTNRALALFAIWITAVMAYRWKGAENKLREEEEARYSDLIKGSELGIQIGNRHRGRIFVNQALAKLFGYESNDELLAARPGDLVAAYDSERVRGFFDTLYDGGTSVTTYEMDGVRKDGSIVPVQVFMRRILWEGEDAIQRTFIDLTERKLAEEAVRTSEAQLRLVTDNIPVQVAYVDRDHKIRYANRRYAEWWGIPHDEVIGMHVRDVRGNEVFEKHLPYSTRTLAGEMTSNEGERQLANGSRQYFHVTRVPHFDDDGNVPGYFVIFVDLTEHHDREEQLRQAQKMEAVGQLTGGVAHDFNNLLTVIQGNLEMIVGRLEDQSMGRMAQSALNASMRGAELTQRLLAFSRKQTLSPKVVDLNELVADMTDMLRRTLGETIEIEVAGGDDLWRCAADPGQLENAILNLALNGRDVMPQGGKLTIETANVKLNGNDVAARNDVSPGEYVMVSVSDTGTGMSRDVIDHAFDPFFTTKGVGAGSGLGLSMVHGFINQSGGFVTIDSAEGVGTKVKLYLPRSSKIRATAPQHAKEKDPVSHGEMVLVVEDDPDVRKLTVNMLADLGYRTIEAGNGKQALEVLQRPGEIDLLFTDVVLPGDMSGIRIAEEADRRFPGIKVLLTSGYAETVLDQHGPVEENIQLIKKPFRKASLAQTVRAVLDQPVQ